MMADHGGLSLRLIIDEVDKVETELKELSRTQQEEEAAVQLLKQMLENEDREIQQAKKKIIRTKQEIQSMDEREMYLKGAVENAQRSTSLLSEMEFQARSSLDMERLNTRRFQEGLEERLRRNRMRIERILEEENSIPLIRKLKDAKNILIMETENMQINSGQEQMNPPERVVGSEELSTADDIRAQQGIKDSNIIQDLNDSFMDNGEEDENVTDDETAPGDEVRMDVDESELRDLSEIQEQRELQAQREIRDYRTVQANEEHKVQGGNQGQGFKVQGGFQDEVDVEVQGGSQVYGGVKVDKGFQDQEGHLDQEHLQVQEDADVQGQHRSEGAYAHQENIQDHGEPLVQGKRIDNVTSVIQRVGTGERSLNSHLEGEDCRIGSKREWKTLYSPECFVDSGSNSNTRKELKESQSSPTKLIRIDSCGSNSSLETEQLIVSSKSTGEDDSKHGSDTVTSLYSYQSSQLNKLRESNNSMNQTVPMCTMSLSSNFNRSKDESNTRSETILPRSEVAKNSTLIETTEVYMDYRDLDISGCEPVGHPTPNTNKKNINYGLDLMRRRSALALKSDTTQNLVPSLKGHQENQDHIQTEHSISSVTSEPDCQRKLTSPRSEKAMMNTSLIESETLDGKEPCNPVDHKGTGNPLSPGPYGRILSPMNQDSERDENLQTSFYQDQDDSVPEVNEMINSSENMSRLSSEVENTHLTDLKTPTKTASPAKPLGLFEDTRMIVKTPGKIFSPYRPESSPKYPQNIPSEKGDQVEELTPKKIPEVGSNMMKRLSETELSKKSFSPTQFISQENKIYSEGKSEVKFQDIRLRSKDDETKFGFRNSSFKSQTYGAGGSTTEPKYGSPVNMNSTKGGNYVQFSADTVVDSKTSNQYRSDLDSSYSFDHRPIGFNHQSRDVDKESPRKDYGVGAVKDVGVRSCASSGTNFSSPTFKSMEAPVNPEFSPFEKPSGFGYCNLDSSRIGEDSNRTRFGVKSTMVLGKNFRNSAGLGTFSSTGFGALDPVGFGAGSKVGVGSDSLSGFGSGKTGIACFGDMSKVGFGPDDMEGFGSGSKVKLGSTSNVGFGSGSVSDFGSSSKLGEVNNFGRFWFDKDENENKAEFATFFDGGDGDQDEDSTGFQFSFGVDDKEENDDEDDDNGRAPFF